MASTVPWPRAGPCWPCTSGQGPISSCTARTSLSLPSAAVVVARSPMIFGTMTALTDVRGAFLIGLMVLGQAAMAEPARPSAVERYARDVPNRDYSIDCSDDPDPSCGQFTTTESIEVRMISSRTARVDIWTRGDNDHSCHAAGVALWVGDTLVLPQKPGDPPSCKVILSFAGKTASVRLASTDSRCDWDCGSRATMSLDKIPLVSRTDP